MNSIDVTSSVWRACDILCFLNISHFELYCLTELVSMLVREVRRTSRSAKEKVFVNVQRISKGGRLRCCNPYDAVRL